MNKKIVRDILKNYFSVDEYGHHRPKYIADCDLWDDMFLELFGEETK